ncbi:hypothetical protein D3C81_2033150 [compost metagenome]
MSVKVPPRSIQNCQSIALPPCLCKILCEMAIVAAQLRRTAGVRDLPFARFGLMLKIC